jgi:hypothetical protein
MLGRGATYQLTFVGDVVRGKAFGPFALKQASILRGLSSFQNIYNDQRVVPLDKFGSTVTVIKVGTHYNVTVNYIPETSIIDAVILEEFPEGKIIKYVLVNREYDSYTAKSYNNFGFGYNAVANTVDTWEHHFTGGYSNTTLQRLHDITHDMYYTAWSTSSAIANIGVLKNGVLVFSATVKDIMDAKVTRNYTERWDDYCGVLRAWISNDYLYFACWEVDDINQYHKYLVKYTLAGVFAGIMYVGLTNSFASASVYGNDDYTLFTRFGVGTYFYSDNKYGTTANAATAETPDKLLSFTGNHAIHGIDIVAGIVYYIAAGDAYDYHIGYYNIATEVNTIIINNVIRVNEYGNDAMSACLSEDGKELFLTYSPYSANSGRIARCYLDAFDVWQYDTVVVLPGPPAPYSGNTPKRYQIQRYLVKEE